MKPGKTRTFLFVLLTGILLSGTPAYAKHDGPHGKANKENHGHHGKGHSAKSHKDGGVVIVQSDRLVINEYFAGRPHCPPGLAKKNNGCMPPGQAKKYYAGQILPAGVIWEPLPSELVVRLVPPPPGATYVMVDQNVLLMSMATRKILDAVVLMSAVR